jgi:photosystem II stability/assembly factor-like uncharacterized protein
MKILRLFIFALLLSHPSFAQWTRVTQITTPFVNHVIFNGDTIFVASDSLFMSTDRGANWISKPVSNNPASYINALIQADGRLFAGVYGEGVYQSTNYGSIWEPLNSGLGAFAQYAKVFLLSDDTLFYGTDGGGIYFMDLNSSQWQSYNQNLPSNYAWTIIDLEKTNTNLIASSGASGFHYLRPIGSAEWIERTITTPSGINTTPNAFLSIGDTVFAGSLWGIFRSFDNGYTWDSVGVRAMSLIAVVAFAKDKDRIYAGFTRNSGNDFYVWYSNDYGDTWNSLDHQFQYLFNLYIYDNKIWAATSDGLWFDELNPTSAEPIVMPSTFELLQNYPNPFNPSTSIEYRIGSTEYVTLKVYDVLGNEVAIIVNEELSAGTYKYQWNASGLSSGIYYYRLTAGNYTEMKKAVLLK